MSHTADLSLVGISKRFGDFTAVDRVDLSVARGEWLSLVGPSGCGKSTTLRIVAGFTAPDGGSVAIKGVDVTAACIFGKDRPGIERADAMLAILDGPAVDDGTACEIGMFHALMQSDSSKKGIVGILTDIRSKRGESTGVNLFVQGVIEDVGCIVGSIDEARAVLSAWST